MLIAYNLTVAELALDAGGVTLDASETVGQRGPGKNVTSELRGLESADYTALQAQAAAGDVEFLWTGPEEYATGALIVGPIVAKMFLFTAPAAPDDNGVHAGLAGNADSEAAAELDLGTLGDNDLDTIVEAAAAGFDGNLITVACVGDSETDAGVTVEEDGNAVTIHYESGVSTVGDVETAIAASTLLAVKTSGTTATVLTAPADNFAATALAGGLDEHDFVPPFTSPAIPRTLNVKFAANWDGGDVTITGTNQYGEEIEEEFTGASDVTVVGEKAFATVTRAVKSAAGADAATALLGWGENLGLPERAADAFCILTADGVAEPGVIDEDNHTIAPDTAPDGAVDFVVMMNVALK